MASGGGDTDKLSDETFDLLCTMCKHDGRNTEAVKYCTDCGDYYCLKCVKVHDTVPVLKGHKVVDKGNFQQGRGKPLPMVPTERCDRHGLKPVDMYCENHDRVGCPTCMTVEHRLCKDIFYIPEYIQTTGSACNNKEIRGKLKSIGKTLSEILQCFENNKQEIMKQKADSIKNIRQFKKDINKRLDLLEQASVANLDQKYEELISKTEEEIRVAMETKTKVKSAEEKLTSTGNNVSQVFVSTKLGHLVAIGAEKCAEEIRSNGSQKEEISFIPDQRLSEMLNELKALGFIEQKVSRRFDQVHTAAVKHKGGLLHTQGMKKYNVSVQSDSTCDIVSSCVLDDGTIILADNRNSKLKRLDRCTYSVTDHYSLPGQPWQVCAINNQEVAVSYCEIEIMFITLGNKMTKKTSMKTDFKCYGLAYAKDNLYISDYKRSVYIYSVSGRKLKQFSQDKSGQALLSTLLISPSYRLAVSKDGSKIYMVDALEGLTVLDNNGQVVGRYNGSKIQKARDVHLTSSGVVLVCGMWSYNVLQFGPAGELIGQVLQSDGCQTVCCNQQMSKMIVGRSGTDEIEVYDLV